MNQEDREAIATYGTAIVAPVCFFGSLAAVANPGRPEAWWGWLFLGGMGIWFLVVLPWLGRWR